MNNNTKIIVTVVILLLQSICAISYAQVNMGVCGGGDLKSFEPPPKREDSNFSAFIRILSYWSSDPNEIVGLEGYDALDSEDTMRWVSASQTLAYTVYFENDAELATAAASRVSIKVPLHEKLNYATLGIGSFGFGSHIFAVEGSPASYQTRIDLRDSLGIYLDVVAGLDIVHNEAFWIFQSIDPATGLPPTDINMGFLPINDSLHSGEGFVTFNIKPNTDQCVTGDTVSATASIVFDVNEAVSTNTWVNTIDAVAPTSTFNIVDNGSVDHLTVTFSGEDDEGGCGVKQFRLYYSQNDEAYQLYGVYPVGDTALIPMESGVEYQFFVLAEDHVGNCEPMKTQPEYNIGTNFINIAAVSFPEDAGEVTGGGTFSMHDTVTLSVTAMEGYHFRHWMKQGAVVSTSEQYEIIAEEDQSYTAYFERNAYTLQTLAAEGSTITVTDLNGNEIPDGSTVLHADKLVVQTTHEQCYDLIGALVNDTAFTSGDTLTVTGNTVISTQTLPLFNASEFEIVACDNYTWNDSIYEVSGDYIQHFTNISGCDSVVTLHLTVNYSNTGDTTAVVCDSFDWYEHTGLTTSGDYTHTFTNASGCDSVVTLHLTMNYSNTGDTTAVVCDSFTWHGTTYTESGNYPLTLTNLDGCDSIVTLHLTVNYTTYGDITVIACDSFAWHGTTYTQSGSYQSYQTNAAGCDSVVTLHLTIYYSNTGDTTAVACNSFTWNGNTYTQSGDYTSYQTTVAGCDSVVTLHLTINNPVHTAVTETACSSFLWNGILYTQSGTYTFSHLDANGCTQVDTLHLTIHNPVHTAVTETACESFTWNGITYTQSGTYTHGHLDANGCTQVDTLHLIIRNPVHIAVTETACESFTWNGTTYTQNGTYTFSHQDVNGCTQVDTLHLTIHNPVHIAVTETACVSFLWNGTLYTQSGTYTFSHLDANGCTQVDTLHLTIHNPVHTAVTETACASFVWNNITYTQSGTYTHGHLDANGCTQVDTLHLTINQPTTGDTSAVACDSFTWNGNTYTESGDYTSYLTNFAGCDSVVTLHLTINPSNAVDTTVFACENFTWNGTTYTESGDYTTNQTNAAGCDSVVTLHLTITDAPALHAISGETEICLNQFATYTYDISEPDYQYRWFKDNALWAENVPQVTLHETGEGSVLLTMSVADEENGCVADTSLLVQVVNRIAPDTTEIRRKGNTNILICQPVTSDYGEVHYRWGYTNRFTNNETTMPGDHNYCLYDFGIDTLSYLYWVETYLNIPLGEGCDNRSYYGHSVLTSTSDYDANTVEAYMSKDHIILYVNALSPENVLASLYDVNGKLLLTRGYGITDVVSDAIAVNIAPGVYFLRVSVGNEFYSFKLLKL